MTSKRALIFITALVLVAGTVTFLIVGSRGSEEQKSKIRVSIRPSNALPVTVLADDGSSETFTIPEFDLFYNQQMGGLTFSSPTYESTEPQFPDNQAIVVNLSQKPTAPPEEILQKALSADETFTTADGYEIKNYRSYGGGRWISGSLVTTNDATDGERVVVENGPSGFVVITAGTYIDRQSLVDAQVPQDIINEIIKDASNAVQSE